MNTETLLQVQDLVAEAIGRSPNITPAYVMAPLYKSLALMAEITGRPLPPLAVPFQSLDLVRPISFFDLETTGTDIIRDRIVEVGAIKYFPDGQSRQFRQIINPGVPIPARTTAIHNITDEMVKEAPSFRDIAPRLYTEFFQGCDVAGFNIARFDIPMLTEHFLRERIPFDICSSTVLDVSDLFRKLHPRTLDEANTLYVGKPRQQAHSAVFDSQTTYEVLLGMLKRHPELISLGAGPAPLVEALAEFVRGKNRPVDFTGMLAVDGEGDLIFCFGQHKGQKVVSQVKYANWMLNADFSLQVKQLVTQALDGAAGPLGPVRTGMIST